MPARARGPGAARRGPGVSGAGHAHRRAGPLHRPHALLAGCADGGARHPDARRHAGRAQPAEDLARVRQLLLPVSRNAYGCVARPRALRGVRRAFTPERRDGRPGLRRDLREAPVARVPPPGAVRAVPHRGPRDDGRGDGHARAPSRDPRVRVARARHSHVPAGRPVQDRVAGVARRARCARAVDRRPHRRLLRVRARARAAASVFPHARRHRHRSRGH